MRRNDDNFFWNERCWFGIVFDNEFGCKELIFKFDFELIVYCVRLFWVDFCWRVLFYVCGCLNLGILDDDVIEIILWDLELCDNVIDVCNEFLLILVCDWL